MKVDIKFLALLLMFYFVVDTNAWFGSRRSSGGSSSSSRRYRKIFISLNFDLGKKNETRYRKSISKLVILQSLVAKHCLI